MAIADHRDDEEGQDQDRESSAALSWLARTMSLLGLCLFLGAVGVLGYEGLFRSGGDPVIRARVETVAAMGGQWHARITAFNSGGTTGAQVTVEGILMRDGQMVERSYTVFDYVPAGSEQDGGLFFTRDPSQYELRLRVLGYAEP